MDYEKKYKEALNDMRAIYPNLKGDAKLAVEHAFPELRESEDERIRKWLLECVENLSDGNFIEVSKQDVLFYLEKQKGDKDELVYRLNGLMQDYIKEGKDDEEKEHRLKCYQLFWDALEDTNFFEQKEQEHICDSAQYEEGFKTGLEIGLRKQKEQKEQDENEQADLFTIVALDAAQRAQEQMMKEFPKWRKIKAGERLPCPAYVWTIAYDNYPDCFEGRLMPNIQGVKVGRDTWYLPVDVIHNLPKEDEK